MDTEQTFTVSFTATSNGDYRLRIVDGVSRLEIAELTLDAKQFAALVTGTVITEVPGRLIGAGRKHLGRVMENCKVMFPLGADEAKVKEWAEHTRLLVVADTALVGRTNHGVSVTFRWYREPGSQPLDKALLKEMLESTQGVAGVRWVSAS